MDKVKPGKKNVFSCDICRKKFRKLDKLKVHFIIHSNEAHKQRETSDETFEEKNVLMKSSLKKTQACSLSGTANNIKKELSTHSHLDSEDIDDHEVSKGTSSNKNNDKLNLNIHKKGKCVSEELTKAVIKKASLRSHFCSQPKEKKRGSEVYEKAFSKEPINLLAHREEKRHSCEICGKTFTRKSSLKEHLPIHSNAKPHICEECNGGFTRKSNLNRHLLIHTKEKLHICKVCGHAFSRKGDLIRHLRTHTKEKPYTCEICNRNFTRKSTLKLHLLVHTKDKPHFCEFCRKAFRYKKNLKVHLRFHTKEKPYACHLCDKAFVYLQSLKYHLLSHTKVEPYTFETCHKGFAEKDHFDSHSLIHRKENHTNVQTEMKHSSDDEL